jgi:hypothetical protein
MADSGPLFLLISLRSWPDVLQPYRKVGTMTLQIISVTAVRRLMAIGIIATSMGFASKDSTAHEAKLNVTSQKVWSQYDDRDSMPLGVRATEGLCFLTMVSGKFEGAGEEVSVYVEDGRWRLGGWSRQKDVAAAARCVKWESGDKLLYTSEYLWEQGEPPIKGRVRDREGFCFLTRVRGDFEGAGERVEIQRDGGYWELYGRSRQDGIAAGMRCVKWPHDLRSPFDEYIWTQRRGGSVALPLRVNEGFCYLSMVQGRFEGGGEVVRVYVSHNGRWRLEGRSLAEGVRATARCVAFD